MTKHEKEEKLDWEMKWRNRYLSSHLSSLAREAGTCSQNQACNDKYKIKKSLDVFQNNVAPVSY